MRARAAAIALLAVAVAFAACGSTSKEATPTATTPTATTPAATTPASSGGIVFFLTSQVGDPAGPYLTAVWRPRAAGLPDAVAELLAGPDRTGEFASPAVTTAIPASTRLLSATAAGDTATVNLTGDFAAGGGSTSMFARLGQLIYTATAQPGITRVALQVDGRPASTFSAEGIVLEGPVGRDFVFDAGVVPPILVQHPAVGEPSTSPIEVSGYAHRLVGGRVEWSRTRGGEDSVTAGAVTVPNAEGPFSTAITVPGGQTGRFDLVVEAQNGAGQTTFLRQLPFTVR